MSRTSRPMTADQIKILEATKARQELKDRIQSWVIIILLIGIVLFSVITTISHHP